MNDKDNDAIYARQLNNVFFRIGATEEAWKQMIPENMDKMKKEFRFMHPYVQAILLQSVIYLSEEQFSSIENDYHELIVQGQSSDDDWVKFICSKFENYPKLSNAESSQNENEDQGQFDYSGLTPLVINNSNVNSIIQTNQEDSIKIKSNVNYTINSVEPPSRKFQIKSLEESQKNQISTNHFYSAPPKRTMQQIPASAPKPATSNVSRPLPNLPPREKKEKTVHSIDEFKSNYFPNKDPKKKTQLTLFHAFNS